MGEEAGSGSRLSWSLLRDLSFPPQKRPSGHLPKGRKRSVALPTVPRKVTILQDVEGHGRQRRSLFKYLGEIYMLFGAS